MPTQTFTSGDNSYTVTGTLSYILNFLEGNDTLVVNGGGGTTAYMGPGNDIVQLRSGAATLFGEAGNDRFEVYTAATVNAGDDDDTINIRGGNGSTLSAGLGADTFNFYAGATNVTLFGNDGADQFYGNGFAITGTIYGGPGNDLFAKFGSAVTLAGGAGTDTYRVVAGSSATFLELAGSGTDTVQAPRGVSFTLPDNIEILTVDNYAGSTSDVATLTGNDLNNKINASTNDDVIFGLGGNDTLSGGNGYDTILGGTGADTIGAGAGNDMLYGEAGNDSLNGGTGADVMIGGVGDDTYYVDNDSDTVVEYAEGGTDTVRVMLSSYVLAQNVENGVANASFASTIYGNSLDNHLTGGGYDDHLYGGEGTDRLIGGAGNDVLDGGTGDDTLRGGEGYDSLTGGAGVDRYFYYSVAESSGASGYDTLSLDSDDYINLTGIDANSTAGGDQNFSLVSAPTNTAGELWTVPFMTIVGFDPILFTPIYAQTGWFIYGDTDGDGSPDLAILTNMNLNTDHIVL